MRWQSFSAAETTLRFFAAYLADQVSFKTIKLYPAGIRFTHTENSLPDPFQEAPLLHLLLCGIKRMVGLSSCQLLPITVTLLQQIKEELARAPDFLPSDKLMLWSAPLRQQPKLVCHFGLSKHRDAGQATASPSTSELHLRSF